MARDVSPALPAGTRLHKDDYEIESCLDGGGFAVTYRGIDRGLDRFVAIKEFFPVGCTRINGRIVPGGEWTSELFADYKHRFLREGRRLAQMRDKGVVTVHAVFEENDTVYLVMELVVGETMEKYLASHGGRPAVSEVLEVARGVGDALSAVHAAGLLHRDLKPSNIMRRPDGSLVLIDFGAAREFLPDEISRMTVIYTPGYAPLEQYSAKGKLGPFTDVYAFGATLYHFLTGRPPVDAVDRAQGAALPAPRDLRSDVPKHVSDTIMWALKLNGDERPATVKSFVDRLTGADPDTVPSKAASDKPAPRAVPGHIQKLRKVSATRRRFPTVAVAAAVLCAALAWGSVMVWRNAPHAPRVEKGTRSTPTAMVSLLICPASGEPAGPYCPTSEMRQFAKGTEPTTPCSIHQRLLCPNGHPIQKGWRFCRTCGVRLQSAGPPPRPTLK